MSSRPPAPQLLAEIKSFEERKQLIDKTLSLLSDPKAKLDVQDGIESLTYMDGESILGIMGHRGGDQSLTDYSKWDAMRVSEYAKTVQDQARTLSKRKDTFVEFCCGGDLEATRQELNHHAKFLERAKTATWQPDTLNRFTALRHLYDGLQSNLKTDRILSETSRKIYDHFSSAHRENTAGGASTVPSSKNKKKKKTKQLWDVALSDLRYAQEQLDRSAWGINSPSLVTEICEGIKGLHEGLSEENEISIRQHHVSGATDGSPRYVGQFRSTPMGPMLSYLQEADGLVTKKKSQLEKAMRAASGIDDYEINWDKVSSLPNSIPDEPLTWFGLAKSTLLDYEKQQRSVRLTLQGVPNTIDYSPSFSAIQPSSRTAARGLGQVKSDIHSQMDEWLARESGIDTTAQGLDRPMLLRKFNQKRAAISDARISVGMLNASKKRENLEEAYTRYISDALTSIVAKSKLAWEQSVADLACVQDSPQSQSDWNQALSHKAEGDYWITKATAAEAYESKATLGMDSKEKGKYNAEIDRDRQRAKQAYDRAWALASSSALADESEKSSKSQEQALATYEKERAKSINEEQDSTLDAGQVHHGQLSLPILSSRPTGEEASAAMYLDESSTALEPDAGTISLAMVDQAKRWACDFDWYEEVQEEIPLVTPTNIPLRSTEEKESVGSAQAHSSAVLSGIPPGRRGYRQSSGANSGGGGTSGYGRSSGRSARPNVRDLASWRE